MPELPEVETVRTHLAPYVVGNRIVQVEVNAPNVLKNTTVPGFRNRVVGKRIEGARSSRQVFAIFAFRGTGCVGAFANDGKIIVSAGVAGRTAGAVAAALTERPVGI